MNESNEHENVFFIYKIHMYIASASTSRPDDSIGKFRRASKHLGRESIENDDLKIIYLATSYLKIPTHYQ